MTEHMRDLHPEGHRRLWQMCGLSLGIFSIFWGIGYVYHGNRYAVSPALHVLKATPGHMHTIGAISLALGMWLIAETVRPDSFYRHWAIRVFCGWCVALVVCIVGAWWVTKDFVFSAPWAWIALLLIAAGMLMYPPPPRATGANRA